MAHLFFTSIATVASLGITDAFATRPIPSVFWLCVSLSLLILLKTHKNLQRYNENSCGRRSYFRCKSVSQMRRSDIESLITMVFQINPDEKIAETLNLHLRDVRLLREIVYSAAQIASDRNLLKMDTQQRSTVPNKRSE